MHFLSQCLNREESLFYKSDIKPLRKPVKHHQMLTVRRAREEVVTSVVGNAVVRGKKRHVACLGDRVATEVEDALRLSSEELGNNIGVEAGAWWVEDNEGIASNVLQRLLAGCENGLGLARAAQLVDITLHLTHRISVDLYERDVITANREANRPHPGIEVERRPGRAILHRDEPLHIAQCLLIDWQVNLEEPFGGVAKRHAKNGILQYRIAKARQTLGDPTGRRTGVRVDNLAALS